MQVMDLELLDKKWLFTNDIFRHLCNSYNFYRKGCLEFHLSLKMTFTFFFLNQLFEN